MTTNNSFVDNMAVVLLYSIQYYNIHLKVIPANTKRRDSVVVMLGQRRRRWTNITTTLSRRFVFAGMYQLGK